MKGKINILMKEHILYVSHTGYKVIRKTNDYVELRLKKDNNTYFVGDMKKKKGINYCNYRNSSESVRHVDGDLYIIRTGDKDIIYDAKINDFIGGYHDRIYQSMILDNNKVFALQDYIKNKQGNVVGLVSSYINFDGKYLSKIYYDKNNTYYDPERIGFDYGELLCNIEKKARLVKVKTKA